MSKNRKLHIWSDEEKAYLREITPGHHHREIMELMNERFKDLDLSLNQIKGAIKRYKLNTGFTGKFNKGNVPVNKGVKGVIYEGCKKTWFKKGHTPANHKPIGSERVDVDGYTWIKVSEPNKWELKHRVVYEQYNGSIPKDYRVIFGDGDKSNLDINNLILVSKKQLWVLNQNKLIQKDAELTRTAIIVADIYAKINDRKRV